MLWKLTLRDGLVWHDGEKVTARDCVASIRRWAAEILQSVGYRPYADLTEASLSAPPANGDWSDQGIAAVGYMSDDLALLAAESGITKNVPQNCISA